MKTKASFLSGILAMLLGQFCFSVNDSLVKWVVLQQSQENSIFVVVFFRSILVCVFIVSFLRFQGELEIIKLLKSSQLYGRGLIEVGSTFFFLWSILILPLTDVYTILLSTPLLITAAGAAFFREKVYWQECSAVLIGFSGVLIVIWPEEMVFQRGYVLPLTATILIVSREIYTKRMSLRYSGMQIVLVTNCLITLASGIASVPFWINLGWNALPAILGAAAMLSVAHTMTILTIRLAPLSVTSPGRYSIIVFGALSAFIILGEIPAPGTIVGSLVIVSSGLFLLRCRRDYDWKKTT